MSFRSAIVEASSYRDQAVAATKLHEDRVEEVLTSGGELDTNPEIVFHAVPSGSICFDEKVTSGRRRFPIFKTTHRRSGPHPAGQIRRAANDDEEVISSTLLTDSGIIEAVSSDHLVRDGDFSGHTIEAGMIALSNTAQKIASEIGDTESIFVLVSLTNMNGVSIYISDRERPHYSGGPYQFGSSKITPMPVELPAENSDEHETWEALSHLFNRLWSPTGVTQSPYSARDESRVVRNAREF